MKKAAVFLLTVMLPVILAGCRPKAAVELPFTPSEVEAAEMFRYVVPADAEKKVITEPADIESLCAVFDGISVQEQALEPAAGSGAAGFRFCLSDGTLYEIVYCPVAVKSGSLYLSWRPILAPSGVSTGTARCMQRKTSFLMLPFDE